MARLVRQLSLSEQGRVDFDKSRNAGLIFQRKLFVVVPDQGAAIRSIEKELLRLRFRKVDDHYYKRVGDPTLTVSVGTPRPGARYDSYVVPAESEAISLLVSA